MEWISPKLDWNSNDNYNFTDLNRVDNNTRYINEFISEFNVSATLESYSQSTFATYPKASLINLIERNLKALRDAFISYIDLTFKVDWVGGKSDISFDYTHANRLEQNLSTMKTMAENIKSEFKYCGTFYTGGDLGL